MKKKGFTLIELLAVIVILAIIAIIAVPIILNVIEKSKESSAVDSAYGYIHAIEEGIVESEVKDNVLVENKEYTDLREFETNYDIGVKGNKPTKGTFRLEKRQVVYAEFVIDGYNVVCNRGKCEARGKTELITITYELDGGTSSKTSDRIGSGTTLTLPVPTKEHYGFVGWYTESTGGSEVTNQTVINESMTLYARWAKNQYTITFDAGSGTSAINSTSVEHGGTIDTLPSCTPPTGYTFNGWYLEDNTEVTNQTVFTEATTVYARYTKNIYTVTYNAGSGSVSPTSTTVEHGNTIELPTPTAPTDYSFAGWYTESSGGSKVISSTPITSTKTIYAHYVKTITNFAYTGNSQTFTVPEAGSYKIELWGAQGGSYSTTYRGGYGGYTSGNILLNKNATIYILVGSTTSTYLGGYNGGGNGAYDHASTNARGGGGSTDVRLIQNDNLSRIMVAGAGGGSGWSSDSTGHLGSESGGLEGYSNYYGSTSYPGGSGGTQISAGYVSGYQNITSGAFYNGGNAYCYSGDSVSHTAGAGGGGYYGGGGGKAGPGHGFNGVGGGGSSYISGHTGCVAITSKTNSAPKSGCTTGTTDNNCSISPYGYTFTNTKMIDGQGYAWTNIKGSYEQMPNPNGGTYSQGVGHSGNGYARITYIGE